MSKVRTFSRTFPAHHFRHGQPTNFVEMIWISLINEGLISLSKCCELSRETGIGGFDMNSLRKCDFAPKNHTIRAGTHFKAGDVFSPRVWSGPAYRSKQITIAPDIEILKTWSFRMEPALFFDECRFYLNDVQIESAAKMKKLSINDGLDLIDMLYWFCGSALADSKRKPFEGQIICWANDVEYC